MKALVALAVLLAAHAHGAVSYFTFAGQVESVDEVKGKFAKNLGIKSGDSVTYVFAVDTSEPGFVEALGYRNAIPDTVDTTDGTGTDYFFDSLLTPPLFASGVVGHTIRTYSGTVIRSGAGPDQFMFGHLYNKGDTSVDVSLDASDPSGAVPSVGSQALGTETFFADSLEEFTQANSVLVLVGISDTRPLGLFRGQRDAGAPWMQASQGSDRIILRNRSGRDADLRIVDAFGKTLRSGKMKEYQEVRLDALPRGVYWLRVTGGSRVFLKTFVR